MKILELFGGRVRDGGEETFVQNALRNLDTRGAQIDCLVVEDFVNDAFREWFAEHGGTTKRIFCCSETAKRCRICGRPCHRPNGANGYCCPAA